MRRRRIDRSKRVIFGVFIFLCVLYIVLLILNLFSNNENSIKKQLEKDLIDDVAPTIELLGGEQRVAVHDKLVEPGYDVYDNVDFPDLEIESNVDTSSVGEYEIHYTAYDESGNSSSVTRKVSVIEPAGRIFLTFDDGPSEHTGVLLDVLKKYGVKATFFVTGYGDDEMIRREFNEGHAVGIHTNTHNYALIYSSLDNYIADFNAVRDRIQGITGRPVKLMRFPGGSSNMVSAYYDGGVKIMSQLSHLVGEWGFTYFDWNVDSDDAGGASSSDEVYNNIINALKVGGDSIVLQHDTKLYSVEAVERIIQYGLEHNFIFESLNEQSFTAHHGVNN